jgi:hypothetical protein
MIYIGDKTFSSKVELRKYTKNLIYDNINTSIKPHDNLWSFFIELFKRHPERDFYGEIQQIDLIKNLGNYFKVCVYTKCKGLHSISIERCVTALPMTPLEKLNKVMRHLIQPEIDNYKLDNTECCFKCKTLENLQTDHETPFSKLRDDFINVYGYPKGEFVWIDNRLVNNDYIFNNGWKRFHLDNATFQTLCKKCNIKKSNK